MVIFETKKAEYSFSIFSNLGPSMSNEYFVSAYATSPSPEQWDPVMERRFFNALAEKPEIIGIEHPYLIQSARYTLPWLKEAIPDHWSILVTTLPLFMEGCRSNPFLGLASIHEADRQRAVGMMKTCRDEVRRLNDALGRRVVKAIHLHSFPSSAHLTLRGNKDALKQSLLDLKLFDWDDAALNLEHCDAYIPGKTPEKGCLLLEDELDVIREVGDIGVVLNWGRSAIEKHSSLGPLQHIQMAKEKKLLKGFFFSGCTDDANSAYGAWKDTHVPPNHVVENQYLVEESVLGQDEILTTYSLLEEDTYMGVKVSNVSSKKTLEQSIGLNLETLEAIAFSIKNAKKGHE